VTTDIVPSDWFEVSPVGVRVLGDVPENVWASTLQSLLRFRDALPWIIGDLILYGEKRYGETYAQAIQVTGRKYDTLAGYVRVCKAIPIEERRADLPFTYHKVTAHSALSAPVRAALLDAAEAGEYTNSTELGQDVRKHIEPERVVFQPDTADCPICGDNGWDIDKLNKAECPHCHAHGIELLDLAERYKALEAAYNALSDEYAKLSARTELETE